MVRNVGMPNVNALLLGILFYGGAMADEVPSVPAMVSQVCAACHGVDGNSTIPTIPKLAGSNPEYLLRELKDFSAGKRKSDIMGAIAPTIDSAYMKAIAAYFGKQKSTSEPVQDAALAAVGKKIFLEGDEPRGLPACAGCHEEDGSGSKRFPHLAGQHRQYLMDQMQKFRNDVHTYPSAKFMREVAKRMSEEEIKAVAEFLAAQ